MKSPYPTFEQAVQTPSPAAECVNMRYGQAFSTLGLLAGAGLARNQELEVIFNQTDKLTGVVVYVGVNKSSPVNQCVPALMPIAFDADEAIVPGVFVLDEKTELGLTEAEWEALGEEVGKAKAEGRSTVETAGLETKAAPDRAPPIVSLSELRFSGNPMRRDRNGRVD